MTDSKRIVVIVVIVALAGLLILGGMAAVVVVAVSSEIQRGALQGTGPGGGGVVKPHTSERFNYVLRPPDGRWRPLRDEIAPAADVVYGRAGTAFFMLIAEEAESLTVEQLATAVETNLQLKSETTQLTRRARTEVGGEPAIVIELDARMSSVPLHYWFCTVTHQGIAYQLVVWCGVRDQKRHGGVLDEWIAGFDFLGDREGWAGTTRRLTWKTFEGIDHRFEMAVPPWRAIEVAGGNGDLPGWRFGCNDGEVWVLHEKREGISIDEFTDEVVSYFEECFEGFSASERTPCEVGGLEAIRVRGSHATEVDRWEHVLVVARGPTRFYRLQYQARAARFEVGLPIFERLVETFAPEAPPDAEGDLAAFPVVETQSSAPSSPDSWAARAARFRAAADAAFDPEAYVVALAASPDGRWLAAITGRDVVVVERASGRSRALGIQATGLAWGAPARLILVVGAEVVTGAPPAFSPERTGHRAELALGLADGALVVFRPDDRPDLEWTEPIAPGGVFVHIASDGSTRELLRVSSGGVGAAAVSPDGQRLAWTSAARGQPALHVTAAPAGPGAAAGPGRAGDQAGAAPASERLLGGVGAFHGLAWTPDGRSIVFGRTVDGDGDERLAGRHDRTNLFAIDVETRALRCLTVGDGYRLPTLDAEGTLHFASDRGADGTWSGSVLCIPLARAFEVASSLPPWPPAPSAERRAAFLAALAGAIELRPGSPGFVASPEAAAAAAEAFAAASASALGRDELDFGEPSLEVLEEIVTAIGGPDADPVLLAWAAGCYHGETLRRTKQARWAFDGRVEMVGPGGAPPGAREELARLINPFAAFLAHLTGAEGALFALHDTANAPDDGRPIVLAASEPAARTALRELGSEELDEADRRLAAGDVEGAASLWERFAVARPNNRLLRHWVGARLAAVGRLAAYRALLERAVTDDPGDAQALVNLGALALEDGDAEKARLLIERGIRARPDEGAGYYHLARVHLAANDRRRAAACLDEALSRSWGPHWERAHRLRESLEK